MEARRWANYELASLIAYATHKPKDMPRYRRLDAPAEAEGEASEYDNARVRAYFMKLAASRSGNGE